MKPSENISKSSLAHVFATLHGKRSGRFYSRGSAGLYALFSRIREQSGPGEIIIPSLCCESVALAAVYAGHTPVFADIERGTLSPGPGQVKQVLSKKTRAVLVVHIFGCDAGASHFSKLRKLHPQICFIEDVAHAVGGRAEDGLLLGSHMDFTMLSFAADKILPGAAGLLLASTGNHPPRIVQELDSSTKRSSDDRSKLLTIALRNVVHSLADIWRADALPQTPPLFESFVKTFRGVIAQPGSGCDAEAIAEGLGMMEKNRKCRIHTSDAYADGITNPDVGVVPFRSEWNCWRLPVICSSPALARELTTRLRSRGLPASNHYFPLHILFGGNQCPETESVASRIINLWVDQTINPNQIKQTIKIINSA